MKSTIDDDDDDQQDIYYNKLPDYCLGVLGINSATNESNTIGATLAAASAETPDHKKILGRVTNDRVNGTSNNAFYDKIPSYMTELKKLADSKRTPCPKRRKNWTSTQTVNRSAASNKFKHPEERRIVYVGNVGDDITLSDLRKRFSRFGPIEEVKVHFREHGDNYGFVTFTNKNDAIAAIQHGNDDPTLPKYELCFGGRRHFCRNKYSDLDAGSEDRIPFAKNSSRSDVIQFQT